MHVRCSQLPPETGGRLSCGNACGKSLACGHHTCAQPCHAGPCAPCAEILVDVPCFCGRHVRTITCGERPPEAAGLRACWSCQEPCGAPLACGHHSCQKPCHTVREWRLVRTALIRFGHVLVVARLYWTAWIAATLSRPVRHRVAKFMRPVAMHARLRATSGRARHAKRPCCRSVAAVHPSDV